MQNSRIYSDMKMLDNFSKKWSIAAKAEIIEINKKLGCLIPEGADYHTLAGSVSYTHLTLPTNREV